MSVNVLGFLLHTCTSVGKKNLLITILSLLGGAPGIVVSILLFDRKPEKSNMMPRVIAACVLVIQIVIFLMAKGHLTENVTIDFPAFFKEHKALALYLTVINLVTFAAFAVDKIAAIKHRSRIRITVLLSLAFIGGSVGAIIAMYTLHHKTKKDYFTVGIPLIMVTQAVLLFFAMNCAW